VAVSSRLGQSLTMGIALVDVVMALTAALAVACTRRLPRTREDAQAAA